ncbi:MAG: dimethyl sulfoxide reductase anchor subunit [Chloroflexi bacterium]|nr:dimethyl sulfoxide reductase anchor subunit [Chloroflexota bacterium]
MNLHEWALIIFTVVIQMAVGSFVVLGVVHFFAARRHGLEEADKLSNRALVAIGPVVVFGLIVTLFHLGNPINAPRAIANIGTSWLSREILLSLLFSFGGALFAFLQWRKLTTPQVRNVVAVVVAVLGLALVYSMAMVYRLGVVPAWDTLATQVTFFITTFLLGTMAMGAAFVANFWYIRRKNMDPEHVQYTLLAGSLRWIALSAIALLGLQFIIVPLYLAALAMGANPAAIASIEMMGQQGLILALRLVLLFVGAGLLAVFVYSLAASEKRIRLVSNMAYLGFALVLIAEVLGRFLFYASMVQVGL